MSNMLFIDSLPVEMTNAGLKALFAPFGSVLASTVARRSATEYLPFGFVTMHSEAQAMVAQAKLNGKILEGNTVRVDNRLSPPFGWTKKEAVLHRESLPLN